MISDTFPDIFTETDPIPGTEGETAPADTEKDTADTSVPEHTSGVISIDKSILNGETVKGRFYSGQSDKIRLAVTYACYANTSGSISVDFEVGLETYDINCGARIDTGKLTVGDAVHIFSTDPISSETGTVSYIPFTTYTYQSTPEETFCTVDASWFFNGVYGGTKLDTLTASAVLDWSALAS